MQRLLSRSVEQEIERRAAEIDRLRHQQVERAEYEADQARQRYMLVDPANRLVADSLETEWNAKLSALADVRDSYEHERANDRALSDEGYWNQIHELTTRFPAVWNHPDTPDRERKRLLALLIEDVTLIKQHELTLSVRFRGGATTTLTLPRPLLPHESRATQPEVRRLINELAVEYTDAQIAHILNERGWSTGSGKAFDGESVQWVRKVASFKSLKERLLEQGWLTAKALGSQLDVSRSTLRRWHINGQLEARICNDNGQWLYRPLDRTQPEKASQATT